MLYYTVKIRLSICTLIKLQIFLSEMIDGMGREGDSYIIDIFMVQ